MRLASWLQDSMHISLRGGFEFALIAVTFLTAEPTDRSLFWGGVLCLLGIALRLWVSGYRRESMLSHVVYGPYCYVRHPFLLGNFLLLLGLALGARTPLSVLLLLIALPVVYRRSWVQEEEGYTDSGGADFARYRQSVSAFFPQLLPVPAQDRPRFSLTYALFKRRRREIDTIAMVAGGIVLLYVCQQVTARSIFQLGFAGFLVLFLCGRFIYYRRRSSR